MEKISYAVLTFLLNSLWQIALIYLTASLFARLMRSAPARHVHCLWVLALVMSLALPLWSLSGFGRDASADAASSADTETMAGTTAFIPGVWMKAATAVQLPLGADQNSAIPYAPGLSLALTICFGLLMFRRLWALRQGWRATVQMRREAFQREMSPLMCETIERCRAALGVQNFSVLCSTRATSPFTVGFRRPVIVLPETLFDETSGDVLGAALGHEMAHLRRRDFPLNFIYTLLSVPISFHPLASLIKRRIGETRELACDEVVVESARIVNASAYARALVHMAASASSLSRPGYALGAFDAGILEERIMKLINHHPRAGARLSRALVFAAALALGLTSFTAAEFALRVVPPGVNQDARPRERNFTGIEAVTGEWVGFFPECADGRSCPPALELTVKEGGGTLSGRAVFYVAVDRGSGLEVKNKIESPLFDLQFDGTTLSFKTMTEKGELLSFTMKIIYDNEGELRNLSVESSSVTTMLKTKGAGALRISWAESVAGDWTLRFGDENTATVGNVPGFTLTFKSVDGELTGTATRGKGAERVEWPLIEPQFDGTTLTFKVNNGEEILEGELKPNASGEYRGLWKSVDTKQSGELSLTKQD